MYGAVHVEPPTFIFMFSLLFVYLRQKNCTTVSIIFPGGVLLSTTHSEYAAISRS